MKRYKDDHGVDIRERVEGVESYWKGWEEEIETLVLMEMTYVEEKHMILQEYLAYASVPW